MVRPNCAHSPLPDYRNASLATQAAKTRYLPGAALHLPGARL